VYFRLTSYNISKKSVTFEEPNLHRRVIRSYDFFLPPEYKQISATVYGVVFNFIVNQANDVYVSILNENGFPVIASIVNVVSGWNERDGLGLSGHVAYQRTGSSQPGDIFQLRVQSD
jgi:hypothetical protein